jgi:hypothetical protein
LAPKIFRVIVDFPQACFALTAPAEDGEGSRAHSKRMARQDIDHHGTSTIMSVGGAGDPVGEPPRHLRSRGAPRPRKIKSCQMPRHENGDRPSGGTPEQGLAESVSCRNNGEVTSTPSHEFLNDEKKGVVQIARRIK